ncbi:glycosyltransferase [Synechococcus sp. KORDI-100]|uniref:CgeB family protein n=1 Tax=Synechococcus sp. KORDI-100 TaxID=1280380 RepID=UPI0012E054C8|nr:glycosyltransferase [Synechococcus sp. KORDI-100]
MYASGVLIQQPWASQHKAHFAGGFGTGDAYSHGLGLLGVEAIEIVANSMPLQRAWAQEYRKELLQLQDSGQQLLSILEAQIRWFKPTVLYVQDINWLPAGFLQHVKPLVDIVVGQNACPLAANLDFSPYDLLLTSLPHYVGKFRAMGVNAAYFPIGFDERLLERHGRDGSRLHALTFVGGLGGFHNNGTQVLEAIALKLPLQVWGYGGQQLPVGSTLKHRWQGEAWAEDMYGVLANSQITINRHIDIAESYANNMRLYEATGMGACLLTDAKLNLPCLFEPDYEVVTYTSPEEAISKLKQLVLNPQLAADIAARGQARTLKHHIYTRRMEELLALLQRHHCQTTVSLTKLPSFQTLLVACRAEHADRIPGPLRQALLREHLNHRMTLVSDAPFQIPALQKMHRWCGSTLALDAVQVRSCLDVMDPDQILIVDDQPTGLVPSDWLTQLKQQAEDRQILCTYVRPIA